MISNKFQLVMIEFKKCAKSVLRTYVPLLILSNISKLLREWATEICCMPKTESYYNHSVSSLSRRILIIG